MKNAGIVIGIVSLIAVAVVGLLLHTTLRGYADSQIGELRDGQKGISADQTKLGNSLSDIEERFARLNLAKPKSYDMAIAELEGDIRDLHKRIDELETSGVAAASAGEDTAANRRKTGLDKAVDDALGAMNEEGDENLTPEEKRSKAMRSLFREGAKEMMKMAKKQQERRLAKAVEKLGLSAGQESQMKTVIDDAMAKARELIDKAIEGEDVREDFQKLGEETDAQAKEILTEDQYKEWKKSDPMRSPGMGRGMWGGRRRGGPSGDSEPQSE
jgi:chromosome segregation ATPase